MVLVSGDDGLPAEEVGRWAKEKHLYLTRYIRISSAVRQKFVGKRKGGAAYFDLFCGVGRSRIRGTNEWIDGSAVAAWKSSALDHAPFSEIYISDNDKDRLNACEQRLRALGAPVTSIHAGAVEAAEKMVAAVNGYGLYLAFIDPYNLEALDFRVIEHLARLNRMDLIIHLSAMDLQRNLASNLGAEQSSFDAFVPGWREAVDTATSQHHIRSNLVDYWRQKIVELGKWPSTNQRPITGEKNQPLYWLLLAGNHPLPLKFWSTAINPEGQLSLF